MESLIGTRVKMKFAFPLDNEVFEIIGERKNLIEIQGDFSAMGNTPAMSAWYSKAEIKELIRESIYEIINPNVPLYDFSSMQPEQKEKILEGFVQLTTKHALTLFLSLGLKEFMQSTIINEPTKDKFILTFKKINFSVVPKRFNDDEIKSMALREYPVYYPTGATLDTDMNQEDRNTLIETLTLLRDRIFSEMVDEEFLKYVNGAKNKFLSYVATLSLPTNDRVEIEDMIIAYDQMVNRLSEIK